MKIDSIVKKGLLLIATPLVIQAVFIGMLIQTQAEGLTTPSVWAVHTKEVIATRRGNLSAAAGRLRRHPHPGRLRQSLDRARPFRQPLEQMPAQIDELRLLVSDNEIAECRGSISWRAKPRRFGTGSRQRSGC